MLTRLEKGKRKLGVIMVNFEARVHRVLEDSDKSMGGF